MVAEKKMGLFRVSQYEFVRELDEDHERNPALEMFAIRVKVLLGMPDAKFLAIPEKGGFMELIQAKNEFIGEGVTEEEAANNCIDKIKSVPASEIFLKRNIKS